MQIKTVRIKHEGFPDGIVINESDFKAAEHELFESEAEEGSDDSKGSKNKKR